jgi:subtilisin family serine protease
VWAGDFANGGGGFLGPADTTIAFIDTGADASHPDLAGRMAFWVDLAEGLASPVDVSGHGTAMVSAACGSGAAAAPTFLAITLPERASLGPGEVWAEHIDLRVGDSTAATGSVAWAGGGEAAAQFAYTDPLVPGSITPLGNVAVGPSPLAVAASLGPASMGAVHALHFQAPATGAQSVRARMRITGLPAPEDGLPRQRGTAPGARWGMVRVPESAPSSTIIAAIDEVIARREAHGVRVLCIALEPEQAQDDPALRQKVDDAVASGIAVVVAAGNGPARLGDPARAARAITVGAAAMPPLAVASYSATGAAPMDASEGWKPDLVAPGGSRLGRSRIAVAESNGADGGLPDAQANDYTVMAGTSLAAAQVAGAVALVAQARGGGWRYDRADDALEAKMLLLATATETGVPREDGAPAVSLERPCGVAQAGAPQGHDAQEGFGVLNLDAALEAACAAMPASASFGEVLSAAGRRAAARRWTLRAGATGVLRMEPAPTLDADIAVYAALPDREGLPVLLGASCTPGLGLEELVTLPPQEQPHSVIVAVKRIAGGGAMTLSASVVGGLAGDGWHLR